MTLMVDHGRLDVQVRDLARRRGVTLPDQQRWLAEMRDAPTAADFERVFANRLRAAQPGCCSTIRGAGMARCRCSDRRT